MNQDLVLNLVSLDLLDSRTPIHASPDVIPGYSTIRPGDLGLPISDEKYSWDLDQFQNSSEYQIETTNVNVIKKIVTKMIRRELLARGLSVSQDFIEGLTVYERIGDSRNGDTILYKKFSLRVVAPREQFACKQTLWSLNVAFSGEAEVTKQPLSSFAAHEATVKKVLVGNEIKRTKFLTADEKAADETKVIVSNALRSALGRSPLYARIPNKYARFFDESLRFYSSYLKGKNIGNFISIFESGFQQISEGQVLSTTKHSNLLVFGENQTHFSPYNGLKEYGPYKLVESTNYRFFFVFHEQDRETANKLHGCLTRGLKGFPGIFRFVGVELNLDREKTITFTNEDDPLVEIEQKLEGMNFDPGIRYLAICISRVRKDEPNLSKRSIYYRLKNALLRKNISSQVIYKMNVDNPNFNYFLPNISIAILAKLGGVPWRLSRPIKHDLVVGIGAFREGEGVYLGTTVAFRNDGTFVRFDSSRTATVTDLLNFFRTILSSVSKDHADIKRLVIHFYKQMNSDEEAVVSKALESLGLKVPYIVLHITDETTFVPFDLSYPGKMPKSGSCITLRNGLYLLCNNTRYADQTGTKIDDFPFPVQVRVSKSSLAELSSEDIQQLIDQVYQFSRMYWVSVKQKGKPVTILYSEKVAEMGAAFGGLNLPNSEVATGSLWFL